MLLRVCISIVGVAAVVIASVAAITLLGNAPREQADSPKPVMQPETPEATPESAYTPAPKMRLDPEPREKKPARGSPSGEPARAAKPRSQPQPNPRGKPEPEPRRESQPQPQPEPQPDRQRAVRSEPDPGSRPQTGPLPVAERDDWPGLKREDRELLSEPRRFRLPPRAIMGLSVKKLGVYNVPIISSGRTAALNAGAIHMPGTSLPWSKTRERNVYIAGHRLGYPGTDSRVIFYELNRLGRGDEIVLRRRNGQMYRYRVREKLVVSPYASWVMGRVRGRDMVSLQTCTPIPTFEKRLVVRAERV